MEQLRVRQRHQPLRAQVITLYLSAKPTIEDIDLEKQLKGLSKRKQQGLRDTLKAHIKDYQSLFNRQ